MTPELWRQIDELCHAARERGHGVLADGLGGLAAAHWLAGDHERGEEMARQFGGAKGFNFGHAVYYAIADQADAIFNALDSACRQRDFHMPFLPVLALFDPWRPDPRFQRQLARINLAPADLRRLAGA